MAFDSTNISRVQVGKPAVQASPDRAAKKASGLLNKLGGFLQAIKQSPVGNFFTTVAKHPAVVKTLKVLKIVGKVFEPLDAAGAGWNGFGTAGEFIGRKIGGTHGAALGKIIGQSGGALLLGGAVVACVIIGGPAAVIAGITVAVGTAASLSAVLVRDFNLHGIMHGIRHPITGLKYVGNALMEGVSFDPLRSDFWKQKNNHSAAISHVKKPAAPITKPQPAAASKRTITVTPPQGLKIKVAAHPTTGDHPAAARPHKGPVSHHRQRMHYGAIRPVTTPSEAASPAIVTSTASTLGSGNFTGIIDKPSTDPISGLASNGPQSQDLTSYSPSDAGRIRLSNSDLNRALPTDSISLGAHPSFGRSLNGDDSFGLTSSLSPPAALSGITPFRAIDHNALLSTTASDLTPSDIGLTIAGPSLPITNMVKPQTRLRL